MDFQKQLKEKIKLIDMYLDEYIPREDNYQCHIYEAMRYSIFAGGKRLRPVIALASCEIVGGKQEDAIPIALAIEMIHTYSLIHDDLPAMDNDDYRRGKPTSHKVFGEAIAILAGDSLLNKAFEVGIDYSLNIGVEPRCILKAMSVIAEGSGTEGMIGGQVVDMLSENSIIDVAKLEYMHMHKTGALIKVSAKAGAIIGGGSNEQVETLGSFASKIGLAFQIKDDILDVEGHELQLGKPVGSDENNGKATFVSLYGIGEARKKVERLTEKALDELEVFGGKKDFLKELALSLINRRN